MSPDRLLVHLSVEILVIIGVARLLGVALRAIGQPQVMGEVLGGIVLGPSVLGWLAPGTAAALFPAASLPALGILSEFGVLFFMFLVGLELDPALVRHHGRSAIVCSLASIATPFLLGVALAAEVFDRHAPSGVPFPSFALFLGAAMSVTAFPVLARILIERDLVRTRVGVLAVTSAAVNDLTAWCLLAVVVAAVTSAGRWGAVGTAASAAAYVAVMLLVVQPVLDRLRAMVDRSGQLSQNLVAIVFVLMLASAATTAAIGIHPIFGAFMLGAVLPKSALFTRELVEKVEDFAVVFLLPVYFAVTGLRTQIGLVDTPALWLECGVIIAVASIGKLGGAAVAGRLTGLSWREAGALGILMNTRGLMELVILNVGLDLGVLSPELFAMMVLMAVVTTLATTPALAFVYPSERFRDATAAGPTGAGAVVVAVALPRSGPLLVELGSALAEGPESPLYALHLVRPPERGALGVGVGAAAHDGGGLAPTLAHARARSLAVRPLEYVSRSPPEDIRDVARAKGASLIVLGWHKPVWSRTVLGGTVHAVMQQARADVVVLIDRGMVWPPRRVLVPYAGNAHDRAALGLARRLVEREHAAMTVLVITRPGSTPPLVDLDVAPAALRVVESTTPLDVVIAEAASHDLVVLGVGEGWQLEPHAFGLRSERLVAECASSLLVVRGRTDAYVVHA